MTGHRLPDVDLARYREIVTSEPRGQRARLSNAAVLSIIDRAYEALGVAPPLSASTPGGQPAEAASEASR